MPSLFPLLKLGGSGNVAFLKLKANSSGGGSGAMCGYLDDLLLGEGESPKEGCLALTACYRTGRPAGIAVHSSTRMIYT